MLMLRKSVDLVGEFSWLALFTGRKLLMRRDNLPLEKKKKERQCLTLQLKLLKHFDLRE